MSTLKTNNVQLGSSATATNNFTWYQPTTPDGTARLGVGNSGATTLDVINVSSTGVISMGTVKTNNVQIGSSATATNNFTWYQPTTPDGTVRLGVGNSGATTLDAINISSTGAATFNNNVFAGTQPEKTANTAVATTAFVDRLRSLTTSTTTSSGGTLVIGDRGSLVSVTAGVTIPANVFAAQDVVTIYNNSASSITITQGGSLTLRQVGTSSTGNRTLALRGLVTVVFISATEAVISGGGLT